jgi:hypothetical protein
VTEEEVSPRAGQRPGKIVLQGLARSGQLKAISGLICNPATNENQRRGMKKTWEPVIGCTGG